MVIFRKSHYESYLIRTMLKFFSTITKHIYNSILKDALQFKILWTLIKKRADSFIKKQKSTLKVPWKLSLAKNATSYFKENCTEIDYISLVIIRFFLSQKNLVLKSNLLTYWIVFATIYLHFYLFIFDILRTLKFSASAPFLWWGSIFFFKVFHLKMFLLS